MTEPNNKLGDERAGPMTARTFRTNRRLWAIAAVCVFVALGFVDPLAGAWGKGNASFWHEVADLLGGRVGRNLAAELIFILLYAGLLSVIAGLFGWLVQGVVVVVKGARQGREGGQGR